MGCVGFRMRLGVLLALAGASSVQAQEVGTFIGDPGRPVQASDWKPDDLQLVKDFAQGMGVKIADNGDIPTCQWRSPLKTAGAYVDGWNGGTAFNFYIRAPVPRASTSFIGLAPSRPDYPKVAFLELYGKVRTPGQAIEWGSAHLVLPPFAGTEDPAEALRHAEIKLGDAVIAGRLVPAPPGLATRVELTDIDRIIDAMAKDEALSARIVRFAAPGDAMARRVELQARFPELRADLRAVVAKLNWMHREIAADRCDIFNRDCMDGQCG